MTVCAAGEDVRPARNLVRIPISDQQSFEQVYRGWNTRSLHYSGPSVSAYPRRDAIDSKTVYSHDIARWYMRRYEMPTTHLLGYRRWYDTMMKDLRNRPSVRPYGRIGLPYYLEAFPDEAPELQIPLENSQFVKDLVNGGIAATTSIKELLVHRRRPLIQPADDLL